MNEDRLKQLENDIIKQIRRDRQQFFNRIIDSAVKLGMAFLFAYIISKLIGKFFGLW